MANLKTGIQVTSNLSSRFQQVSTSGADRFFKVQIINDETLDIVSSEAPGAGTWEEQFDIVPKTLEPKQACFILYRTDKQNSDGRFLWYLLCYVPDTCPVRQKMLYASTRYSLRQDLGTYNFIDEIHGTDGKDFGAKGYKDYYIAKTSEAPLTEGERLKKEELEASYRDYVIGDAGQLPPTVQTRGVAFPVDQQVYAAFDAMKAGTINYMRLVIDIDAEIIKVDHSGNVSSAEVGAQVPKTDARFISSFGNMSIKEKALVRLFLLFLAQTDQVEQKVHRFDQECCMLQVR
jgi:twinfilin-like protein